MQYKKYENLVVDLAKAKSDRNVESIRANEAEQKAEMFREQCRDVVWSLLSEREEMKELREQLKSANRKASIWKTKCQNLRGTK
jgi:hypothetical protein